METSNETTLKNKADKKALVVRRNDLVFGRHKMSVQEARLFLWLVSQIEPGAESFKSRTLGVREFCDLVGLAGESMFSEMAEITRRMIGRVVEVNDRDLRKLIQRPLLSSAEYAYGEGYVTLKLHEELKPYLLKVKEHFTAIELDMMLRLKSRYSISLYEIVSAEKYKGDTITFALNELKRLLGIEVDEYDRFSNFKARVLEPATKEVSKSTDLSVGFSVTRVGRLVDKVVFNIRDAKTSEIYADERDLGVLFKKLKEVGMGDLEAQKTVDTWGVSDPDRINFHVANCASKKIPLAWLRAGLKEDYRPKLSAAQQARERELDARERLHDKALKNRPHTGGDAEIFGDVLNRIGEKYAPDHKS